MKAFIIMEKGYEYNDEIYSESDNGGGHPKKVYFDRIQANKDMDILNMKELKNCDIGQYAYDIEDILRVDEEVVKTFLSELDEKYGKVPNKYGYEEFHLNENANDEEVKKFSSMLTLSFFEIVETEVDVTSYRDVKIDSVLK